MCNSAGNSHTARLEEEEEEEQKDIYIRMRCDIDMIWHTGNARQTHEVSEPKKKSDSKMGLF